MPMTCVDHGPFACHEDGCPSTMITCYALAARLSACNLNFGEIWKVGLPDGIQVDQPVHHQCAASCSRCTADELRATVAVSEPRRWPWPSALQPVESVFAHNMSAAALAHRIAIAGTVGPLIIRQAYGEAFFRPEAWSREALRNRCAPTAPPAPPWPTIAYREPAAIGKRWAGLHFDNGAAQGVRDLVSLIDAQDAGRLRGVVLFDSPANRTCPPVLLRANVEDNERHKLLDSLPAPRFFPRDFEVVLGSEGLWRKGGAPMDDPDLFVSKAGTQTHVHIDAHCTRFWMLGLSGRKLWRVLPPDEVSNLAPSRNDKGGEHFLADVLDPTAEANADVGAQLGSVGRLFEFELAPGDLVLIPEGWPHAVHNLDDTVALTYNFVDEANLECYVRSLRAHVGKLLVKLVSQLAQGRRRQDAADAFSQHTALAYYEHLSEHVARRSPRHRSGSGGAASTTVAPVDSILDEHIPWDTFAARQHQHAAGHERGTASQRVRARLLALMESGPLTAEPVEALLDRFDAWSSERGAAKEEL